MVNTVRTTGGPGGNRSGTVPELPSDLVVQKAAKRPFATPYLGGCSTFLPYWCSNPLYSHFVRRAELLAGFRNPPTRSACTVFFSYVASKILSQLANPKSPVPQTPKISKIQNPRSPKSKIQNPQIPKSKLPKFQNPNFAHKDLLHNVPKIQNPKSPKIPKAKIQNPQNPKSKIPKIPKIQNPKSPKSKIQNPKSPKSKILYPQLPKSKIQNPRQNPKYGVVGASHKELLHNDPKSKIQNPENLAKKVWIGDFGFWIWDSGPKIQNPNSPKSKIQNAQNPKSQTPKIQNPKSKIPKIQNPKSPKSKIQNPPPKSKIWGVGGLT